MRRSIPKCTAAQQARQDAARAIGCIVCRDLFSHLPESQRLQCGWTEIHHMNSGGRNRGQDFTVALGSWHHRAVVLDGWGLRKMVDVFGASLARGSKTFHAEFGSDDELLARQNELIGATNDQL